MPRTEFKRDIERDARLVYLAMREGPGPSFVVEVNRLGWSTDAALVEHPAWLRAQGKHYLKRVSDLVAEMERRA